MLTFGARWSCVQLHPLMEKKCCRRRRRAQLTPLYGLVHRILLMLVAAATFIARERWIVGACPVQGYHLHVIWVGIAVPEFDEPWCTQFAELMNSVFLV